MSDLLAQLEALRIVAPDEDRETTLTPTTRREHNARLDALLASLPAASEVTRAAERVTGCDERRRVDPFGAALDCSCDTDALLVARAILVGQSPSTASHVSAIDATTDAIVAGLAENGVSLDADDRALVFNAISRHVGGAK